MTTLINFNKARKAKIKQSEKLKAEENRVRFGVSTKTRRAEKESQEKAAVKLDGHRLTPGNPNKKS